MLPGLFGWSLWFELLVGYFALSILWPTVERKWVYVIVGLLALIAFSDVTSARWAEIFSGHYDYLWDEIFRNFGFR